MMFCGFLAFLDPPKDCAVPCIHELHFRGVAVKVRPDVLEAHLATRSVLLPLRADMRHMLACCVSMPELMDKCCPAYPYGDSSTKTILAWLAQHRLWGLRVFAASLVGRVSLCGVDRQPCL